MKFDFLSKKEKIRFINKASTLVEALPYIREHANKNIVIKYGGHAMGNKELSKSFSQDICLLKEIGINPIIIHGGGPQIAKELMKKKIKSNFIDGLRVTDKETIKIVEKILFKQINKKIVNEINMNGGKAISMSGCKNNLIKVTKLNISKNNFNQDLGFVGNPKKIDIKFIKKIINKGQIPVIAPLGVDQKGNTYNINADTAAGAIAGSIKSSKLLLLTDVSGILDKKKKLISSISVKKANKIILEKHIKGGMKPKILTCINAIKKGVREATILDGRIPHSVILELFTEHGIGTQIYS